MPADGVDLSPRSDILTFEEIEQLARLFVRLGIRKIRLTGGEPLVRKDVEQLVGRLSAIRELEDLTMTTNGIVLARKIDALQSAGITAFNISLDTLRPDRFESITRRTGLSEVLNAIRLTLERGFVPLKINCVVMRGINDDEIADFVAMTEDSPIDVRFIEYMPFSGNGWNDSVFVPYSEMLQAIENRFGVLHRESDGPNDTSKTYRVPGFEGTIGFISSMSDHFCSSCNRLRLTADGNLKVCLFGSSEVSLRDHLRDGATDLELTELISAAVQRKAARHAGMYELADADDRPMILIGG